MGIVFLYCVCLYDSKCLADLLENSSGPKRTTLDFLMQLSSGLSLNNEVYSTHGHGSTLLTPLTVCIHSEKHTIELLADAAKF